MHNFCMAHLVTNHNEKDRSGFEVKCSYKRSKFLEIFHGNQIHPGFHRVEVLVLDCKPLWQKQERVVCDF